MRKCNYVLSKNKRWNKKGTVDCWDKMQGTIYLAPQKLEQLRAGTVPSLNLAAD